MSYHPPAALLAALDARDESSLVALLRGEDSLMYWIGSNCTPAVLRWVAAIDYDTNYDECYPLLHRLINDTHGPHYLKDILGWETVVARKRAILCYVLRGPGVRVNIRTGPGQVYTCASPLECALDIGAHFAVTQLLKAGAALGSLDYDNDRYILWDGWFSCLVACRAALVAFLGANRKRRCMPRDVALLVARVVWEDRYALEWMPPGYEWVDRSE